MMELPKFFDVDGTLAKFELDHKTGEVVSTTVSGAPFPFGKVLEGTEITEKEYNMLRIFPLTRAIEIAKLAHKDQLDKAGKPYIDHPFDVMNQLNGNMAKMTGVLHDVVEDSDITFDELEKMGCPLDVAEALKLVTHPKDYKGTGEEYISGIQVIANSGNQLAIDVKYADLTHNSDLSRLSNSTEKDFVRIAKYKKSMEILKPLVSDYLKKII